MKGIAPEKQRSNSEGSSANLESRVTVHTDLRQADLKIRVLRLGFCYPGHLNLGVLACHKLGSFWER